MLQSWSHNEPHHFDESGAGAILSGARRVATERFYINTRPEYRYTIFRSYFLLSVVQYIDFSSRMILKKLSVKNSNQSSIWMLL
jgi:hypothetical protein